MLGPLLALTASLSWGFGDFLAGLRTRRLPVVTVVVVSQAAGLATIALVVALRGVGPPDARYLGYAALAGVAGAIGITALYKGLAVGPMSIVAPISATAAVVPVVADLLEGGRPSSVQAAGIGLAIVGVVLASRSPGRRRRASGRGEGSRAGARRGALVRLPPRCARRGQQGGSVLGHAHDARHLVLALRADRDRASPSFALGRYDLPVLLLIGVLDTAGNALFAVATTKSLLSVAAVLGQLYPVVTVLLARLVLGERVSNGQGVGIGSAFAGVALISIGST